VGLYNTRERRIQLGLKGEKKKGWTRIRLKQIGSLGRMGRESSIIKTIQERRYWECKAAPPG